MLARCRLLPLPTAVAAGLAAVVVLIAAGGCDRSSATADGATESAPGRPAASVANSADENEDAADLRHYLGRLAGEGTPPGRPLRVDPPAIPTDIVNYQGVRAAVSCATCHSVREPDFQTRSGPQLQEFHQGLDFNHGALSCLTCHNADDYDTLRLADNTPVEFARVAQLCAQCHSSQHRDYQHGAHGGMTGFWDETRGRRIRNSCIDCHDPHHPAFPTMAPVFPPRDGLPSRSKGEHHE